MNIYIYYYFIYTIASWVACDFFSLPVCDRGHCLLHFIFSVSLFLSLVGCLYEWSIGWLVGWLVVCICVVLLVHLSVCVFDRLSHVSPSGFACVFVGVRLRLFVCYAVLCLFVRCFGS